MRKLILASVATAALTLTACGEQAQEAQDEGTEETQAVTEGADDAAEADDATKDDATEAADKATEEAEKETVEAAEAAGADDSKEDAEGQ